MKINSRFLLSACVASIFLGASATDPFKVRIPTTSEDLQGAMLYLVDYDTTENIDSVLIDGPEVIFEGTIDEPALVRMIVDGRRVGSFILENGSFVWDPRKGEAIGSPLNDALNAFSNSVEELAVRLRENESPEVRDSVFNAYEQLVNKTLDDNSDNPIGYYLFIQEAADLSEKDFEDYLAKYPGLAKYQRVGKIRSLMQARRSTQPGNKYVDFSITQPNGEVATLSQYVKPGKYTLVDFWASWCGPCIREISTLKQLWDSYHDKGLDIVGVAVWDEPQNTLEAIVKHEIPWPCIINAQTVPTDLYGISGIPCILLIGPDGTILSRDKQDTDLMFDVINALNSNKK